MEAVTKFIEAIASLVKEASKSRRAMTVFLLLAFLSSIGGAFLLYRSSKSGDAVIAQATMSAQIEQGCFFFQKGSYALTQLNDEYSDQQLAHAMAELHDRHRVTIIGLGDQDGPREETLAVGARRASAVKEWLVSRGVDSALIETISFGKEVPTEMNAIAPSYCLAKLTGGEASKTTPQP